MNNRILRKSCTTISYIIVRGKNVYFWDAVRVFYIRVRLYVESCAGVENDFYLFINILSNAKYFNEPLLFLTSYVFQSYHISNSIYWVLFKMFNEWYKENISATPYLFFKLVLFQCNLFVFIQNMLKAYGRLKDTSCVTQAFEI